jgi:hypothetical protein
MPRHRAIYVGSILALALSGCASEPGSDALTTASIAPVDTSLKRGTQVIAGQTARVFTFAGLGAGCAPSGQPQLTIDRAPTKGAVTFEPVAPTTIQYSISGNCIGQRVAGTGIYYTPRAGEVGVDSFIISARSGRNTEVTRTIDVRIAD